MTNNQTHTGLSFEEVKRRQLQYGKNELSPQKKENFFKKILHILCGPRQVLFAKRVPVK